MDIAGAIDVLNNCIENPKDGLPDEIFYFLSEVTPLVNVDLLIKDENGRALLSWRNDNYSGKGWHIPGGIIRLKETIIDRLEKVAFEELGTEVEYDSNPISINELISPTKTRSHFVSFLYKCHLPANYVPENNGLEQSDPGYLMWHNSCPENLIKCQDVYRVYINHR